MKMVSLVLVISILVNGCGNSNVDILVAADSAPLAIAEVIQDRTWTLVTVQDNKGNLSPVTQDIDFEFTLRLSSNFIFLGDGFDPEAMSVSGTNVCNFYGGGYTLDHEVLNLVGVVEEERSCERANEITAEIFSLVLFTPNNPPIVSIALREDVLTLTAGTNEALIFEDRLSE